MSIERYESEYGVGVRCYWRQPYKWDQRIQTGTMYVPEGMAEIYLSFDATEGSHDRELQEITVDTVVDGRYRSVMEKRTRRDWVTKRGAQIIARRWLRDVLEAS